MCGNMSLIPLKTKLMFYVRTQCVPRSKHSPLGLHKACLLMSYKVNVHTEHWNAM